MMQDEADDADKQDDDDPGRKRKARQAVVVVVLAIGAMQEGFVLLLTSNSYFPYVFFFVFCFLIPLRM